MPDRNQAVMDFLLARRSRPARTLAAPYPDRAALEPILTAAARTPDHGKLEPWRFVVLQRDALRRVADQVVEIGAAQGRSPEDTARAAEPFRQSGLAVVVVASPKVSEKIPAIEQTYSAGAVCLALLNAALASGWGANWLSGWPAHDADVRRDAMGLAAHERIAGIIHIGTETAVPPDRPRPDLGTLTQWVDR